MCMEVYLSVCLSTYMQIRPAQKYDDYCDKMSYRHTPPIIPRHADVIIRATIQTDEFHFIKFLLSIFH